MVSGSAPPSGPTPPAPWRPIRRRVPSHALIRLGSHRRDPRPASASPAPRYRAQRPPLPLGPLRPQLTLGRHLSFSKSRPRALRPRQRCPLPGSGLWRPWAPTAQSIQPHCPVICTLLYLFDYAGPDRGRGALGGPGRCDSAWCPGPASTACRCSRMFGDETGPWFLWWVKGGQRVLPSPTPPIPLAWQRKTLNGIKDTIYSQAIRPQVPPGH